MRTKNKKLRGNKKEMLLLVDQNTKLDKGTGKGNLRGRNKNCCQYPKAQSPRERKRYPPGNGRFMRLCECLCRCG